MKVLKIKERVYSLHFKPACRKGRGGMGWVNKPEDLTVCHSIIHSLSDNFVCEDYSTYLSSKDFNLIAKTNVKTSDMSDIIPQIKHLRVEDKALFEQIFSDHYDGMFRYCMTMVQNQSDAEDIVQSVFMDFWQDKHKLVIHTSIQAFLYKSVYFKCMNRIKREKVSQKYIASVSSQDANTSDSDPAILQEVTEKINEAIDALPDQCRKIFTLSRYEGMRYQEIADHMKLSIKTIENQMGKALKNLRIHLSDYLQVIIFNLLIFF
ncbi:MAG: RNA polymerase sigma-70 factor [Saprospiraceae bacterium]|jgi:RNA polymerase sigma-70 factor (ECF subfamily)|nr:RNA polymerase sigma-70 factor [Saprospiraceae bacterium]